MIIKSGLGVTKVCLLFKNKFLSQNIICSLLVKLFNRIFSVVAGPSAKRRVRLDYII